MKKTVCVDLDGVLADYEKGWQGVDHIGDPIPGAVEFTKRLGEFARVVVFTTRCKVDVEGRKGAHTFILAARVADWLARHGFHFDEVYTGQGKPMAAAYVDDRAVICRPQSPFVRDTEEGIAGVFKEALWAAHNLCETR